MQAREWARLYRRPQAGGLELIHARYVTHRFTRHAHEHYVVGMIETGVQTFWCRGALHTTPAGGLFLIDPGEPHTGEALGGDGFVYRTSYPTSALMEQVHEEVSGRAGLPHFTRSMVADDPVLTAAYLRFHRAVSAERPALECDWLMRAALARLVTHHSEDRPSAVTVGRERPAVRRAREYLEAHYAQDVPLATLASVAGLSPYHLARAFTAQVGLPPHAYLEGVRIRRARQMLDAGGRLSFVALSVGYPDQSHFTRRFKAITGLTPGQYARGRKITQDGADA